MNERSKERRLATLQGLRLTQEIVKDLDDFLFDVEEAAVFIASHAKEGKNLSASNLKGIRENAEFLESVAEKLWERINEDPYYKAVKAQKGTNEKFPLLFDTGLSEEQLRNVVFFPIKHSAQGENLEVAILDETGKPSEQVALDPDTSLKDFVTEYLDKPEQDSAQKKKVQKSLSYIYGEKLIQSRDNNNEAAIPPEYLSDSKLEKADNVKPVFEGTLNREALAETLRRVMIERDLSERKAAAEAGTTKSIISKIKSCDASIDKTAEVLESLGYRLDISIVPANE